MDKKILAFLILTIILVVAIVGVIVIKPFDGVKKEKNVVKLENTEKNEIADDKPEEKPKDELKTTDGLNIVPTMSDEITGNSAWCCTFQLVWNDMKNDVVKKDVEFTPQEKMAENLNKEEFTENMISDEYYYKKYGLKTLDLKEEIEKGIKEKFDQTSDILEDFDWSEDALEDPNNKDLRRYFFYTMLYREFEYPKEFDVLEKGKFGKSYDNVEYFGIDGSTDNEVGKQIEVLYYNSQDDFAVILETKSGDEVIFCKNPEGKTFNEIYENMNKKAEEYKGDTSFGEIDEFKAPKISFKEKREYKELQGKEFKTADPIYDVAKIEKAIQSIEFSIDEKGGKIKSEAAIDMTVGITAITEPKQPRYFYVDDTFAMFLREEGKDLPYFAARIEDITKFQ